VHQFQLVDPKELAPVDDLVYTLTGGLMGNRTPGEDKK
jgi:hypothetical protein